MSGNPQHEGHRARIRERFLSGDAGSRSDEALLELLLTYAIPQRDVQPLAKSLITKLGSLEAVLGATVDDLCKIDGLKQNSVVLLKLADEFQRRKTGANHPSPSDASAGKALETKSLVKQEEMAEILKGTQQKGIPQEEPAFRRPVARYGTELFGKAVLKEAIEMLPKLPESEDLDKAREFLRHNLHFSAEGTRSRYANYITRRMFPKGVADVALRHFARAFPETTQLRDVCFYRFCIAEPLMLKIVQDLLLPALGVARLNRQRLTDYLRSRFPNAGGIKDCSVATAHVLEVAKLAQVTRTEFTFHPRPVALASFAFILHSEFPEPGMYDLAKLESNAYFRSLLWEPAQMVNALYECRNVGWISKISQIDNVRQFTLRNHLPELVEAMAKEAEKR